MFIHTDMNYIELSQRYRLYAFNDYWIMRKAYPEVKYVAFAKDLREIREIEAKHYVSEIGPGGGYQNYLRQDKADLKSTGLESLKTALQALYKLNGYSAKYILIEGRY